MGGGAAAGVIVLAVGAACLGASWRMGALRGAALAVTVTGLLATVATAAAIAQSRAAIPGFTFFNFNRYLHNVGLPLAIAFLPSAIGVARRIGERWLSGWPSAARSSLVAALLIGAWAASLDEEDAYGDVLVGWNEAVDSGVRSTVAVIGGGCPPGTALDRAARPVGDVSPQLTVQLVAELIERDLLTRRGTTGDVVPDPAVVARICVPAGSSG